MIKLCKKTDTRNSFWVWNIAVIAESLSERPLQQTATVSVTLSLKLSFRPLVERSEPHEPISGWSVIIIYFINWHLCRVIEFHDETKEQLKWLIFMLLDVRPFYWSIPSNWVTARPFPYTIHRIAISSMYILLLPPLNASAHYCVEKASIRFVWVIVQMVSLFPVENV